MYQIFESPLYLLYEKTTVVVDDTPDDKPDKSITKTIEPVKPEVIKPDKKLTSKLPPKEEPPLEDKELPPDEFPSEEFPEEELEATPKEKYQAIQKFILYNKLRELQYKLDNTSTIAMYKDKDEVVRFTKFLSYVIRFFSIFDYAQAFQISDRLLTEFKKIK